MPTVDLLQMLRDVDWNLAWAVLLVVNTLIAAGLELTGYNPLAPHSGQHTRKARLASPAAVDETQPVVLAAPKTGERHLVVVGDEEVV